MGADLTVRPAGEQGGEPVADIEVRAARLRGAAIPEALVPDMIDEFPALFTAAALAEGTTVVSGAAELRVKESDRIAVMAGAFVRSGRSSTKPPTVPSSPAAASPRMPRPPQPMRGRGDSTAGRPTAAATTASR